MTLPAPTAVEIDALKAEAVAFAEERLRPGAAERDRNKTFPRAQVEEAATRGWLGLLAPRALGGVGYGNYRQAILLEEMARVDAPTHVTVSVHNSLVVGPIVKYGSDDLKARYVPSLAKGETLGAYALTEPNAGSDAAALACSAEKVGGAYVLNGSKMWITTGGEADVIVVFARTDKEAPKAKGVTAFVVRRDAAGLTVGKPENKLGIRASETVQLFFENVRVDEADVLGEVGRGFNYALETLNGGRVGIAVQAVGLAQGALDAMIRHVQERLRGGKPVRASQDEEFRIAEAATRVEAARLLTHRAARLRDLGVAHVREASMAKLFASQTANEVARSCADVMGPAAWLADSEVERIFRDARITEIYEGTTEVQKLVIARTLLAKG